MSKITVVSSNISEFKPIKLSIEIEIDSFEEYQKFREDIKYTNEEIQFDGDLMEELISEIKEQL